MAINKVRIMHPINEITFIIFFQLFLNIFEMPTVIAIPIAPPIELEIMSVISLAHIPKTNCKVSKMKLVKIIGKSFLIKVF